eukprot:9348524-Pyramimonas_sp.AAC.2
MKAPRFVNMRPSKKVGTLQTADSWCRVTLPLRKSSPQNADETVEPCSQSRLQSIATRASLIQIGEVDQRCLGGTSITSKRWWIGPETAVPWSTSCFLLARSTTRAPEKRPSLPLTEAVQVH